MVLVDGHNLIGRTPGLGFRDEAASRAALLERLAAWASGRREPVTVVFDGAWPGGAGPDRFGVLRVVYAPAGRSADEEILRRVERQGGRGVTVVTSDRALAGRVRARGARVESCEAFLRRVAPAPSEPPREDKPEPVPGEVEYWLRVFGEGRDPGRHNM